ncbi:MAG: hypothetical protein QOE40_2495 [Actinomycetota bacterium]|nr:hypothetical protein [Actinomycetota bacterium]
MASARRERRDRGRALVPGRPIRASGLRAGTPAGCGVRRPRPVARRARQPAGGATPAARPRCVRRRHGPARHRRPGHRRGVRRRGRRHRGPAGLDAAGHRTRRGPARRRSGCLRRTARDRDEQHHRRTPARGVHRPALARGPPGRHGCRRRPGQHCAGRPQRGPVPRRARPCRSPAGAHPRRAQPPVPREPGCRRQVCAGQHAAPAVRGRGCHQRCERRLLLRLRRDRLPQPAGPGARRSGPRPALPRLVVAVQPGLRASGGHRQRADVCAARAVSWRGRPSASASRPRRARGHGRG